MGCAGTRLIAIGLIAYCQQLTHSETIGVLHILYRSRGDVSGI